MDPTPQAGQRRAKPRRIAFWVERGSSMLVGGMEMIVSLDMTTPVSEQPARVKTADGRKQVQCLRERMPRAPRRAFYGP